MDKETSYVDKIQVVSNIILIVGSLSFILFFVGIIENGVYYTTLGVNRFFSSISYTEYVSDGVFVFLILIFSLLPYFLKIYYYIYLIEKHVKDTFRMEIEIKRAAASEEEKKELQEKLKKTKEKLGKLKEQILNPDFLKKNISYITYKILFVISLILSTFFIYNKNYTLLGPSLICMINLIIILYLINYFHKILGNEYYILEILDKLAILFSILMFILPATNGFLLAKMKLYSNNFDQYSIVMDQNNKIDDASLISSDENNYFFLIKGKMSIIPADKIMLMIRK